MRGIERIDRVRYLAHRVQTQGRENSFMVVLRQRHLEAFRTLSFIADREAGVAVAMRLVLLIFTSLSP